MLELLKTGICLKYFPGSNIYIIIGFFVTMAAGYFLGSLNFAIIISKLLYRDDIRKYGSGNAGMTNMLRTYGKPAAALTLLGDVLKTFVAVQIGAFFLGDHIMGFAGTYFGGLASILGHVYPVYYRFKGGKGVAAAATMVLCTDPIVFAIVFVIFVIIVAGTKYLSLGSIMGMIIYPLLLVRMTRPGIHVLIAIVVMLLVIYLHRGNIMRLREGKESKFSLKKKPPESKKPDEKTLK